MTLHDYESFAYVFGHPVQLSEAYSGQAVVSWQGRIERQLIKHIEEYEAARNPGYADKLRAFLQMWRQHQLTGSLNVETIDALSSATEVLGVDPWKLQTYFSNLRDQLRKLKASVEELPMDVQSQAEMPPQSGGGGMGGMGGEPPAPEGMGPEGTGGPEEEVPGVPGEAPPEGAPKPNPEEEEQPPV